MSTNESVLSLPALTQLTPCLPPSVAADAATTTLHALTAAAVMFTDLCAPAFTTAPLEPIVLTECRSSARPAARFLFPVLADICALRGTRTGAPWDTGLRYRRAAANARVIIV